MMLTAALGGLAAATDPFETAPDEAPATSLTIAERTGEYFHIEAPVHSDGLMHHYVVVSQFGRFLAYGHGELTVRLREVAALSSIAKTSDSDVALQAIARGLRANANVVGDLAKNPVGAVTGIPQGIGHLFGGYRARAEEVSAGLQRTRQPA